MNKRTKNSLTTGLLLSTAVLGVYASKGYVSADELTNNPSTSVVSGATPSTGAASVEAPKVASTVEATPTVEVAPKAEVTPTTGVTPTNNVAPEAPTAPTVAEAPTNKVTSPVEAVPTTEVKPSVSETPKAEEKPKAETPKVEEKPKEKVITNAEEKPSIGKAPKSEDGLTSKDEEKPNTGELPKSEETPKASTPTFNFTLGGRDESVTDTPSKLDLGEEVSFENNTKHTDVTYKQVTSNGVTFDLTKNKVKPITSKLIAVYKDDKGEEQEVPVAEITGTKVYNLGLSYSNTGNSVTYTFDVNQLLEKDSYQSKYKVLVDGVEVQDFDSTEDEITGTLNLINKLSEGTHTVEIAGQSKFGVVVSGKDTVIVPKEFVPNPSPAPLPNSDKQPGTATGGDVPYNPVPGYDNTNTNPKVNPTVNPTVTPTVTPAGGGDAPVVNPDRGNTGGLTPTPSPIPSPSKDNNPYEVPTAPQPTPVKEPVRGVEDVRVGGVSIYGDAPKSSGVASNGDTTTFTDPKKVDIRVNLDTSVIDSSRTVLKLVGREQGEIGASQFVELKDGAYKIKGVAKDDFYTLTIKAYDKNGNLVTDTVETFSVNKGGSKYSISNKGLAGSSVKNLNSNLKIEETNVDKIKSDKTTIKVFLDGKLVELPKDAIKVSRSGGVSGKWKYTYSINKNKFKAEGVYTIEVYSESETGVNYNSTKKTLQFTVDRTPAEISISGVRDGGRYKASSKRITIDIRDISELKSVKAFLNGKEVELEYDSETGLYYYEMKSSGKGKNEFVVEVEDAAGNVSTETVKGFYLSEDLAFSIFNDDNLYWLLGGIAAATGGFLGFLALRRKRKLDEEDRLALEQAELLAASASSSGSETVGESPESSDERFNVDDILPAGEEILSVSTEEVQDTDLEGSQDAEDLEATDVLPEDEEFSEDDEATDVIPEDDEDSEDNEATDVIEDDEDSEDNQETDVIEDSSEEDELKTDVIDDDSSEDNKPTDIVED